VLERSLSPPCSDATDPVATCSRPGSFGQLFERGFTSDTGSVYKNRPMLCSIAKYSISLSAIILSAPLCCGKYLPSNRLARETIRSSSRPRANEREQTQAAGQGKRPQAPVVVPRYAREVQIFAKRASKIPAFISPIRKKCSGLWPLRSSFI
jgi:hypothetical protein